MTLATRFRQTLVLEGSKEHIDVVRKWIAEQNIAGAIETEDKTMALLEEVTRAKVQAYYMSMVTDKIKEDGTWED
jgi:hypothetical protein